MINVCKPFPLGRVVATPDALAALSESGEDGKTFLDRHSKGDWGEIDQSDWAVNDEALRIGDRVVSAYNLKISTRIWIITEADRSVTTILLPEDY